MDYGVLALLVLGIVSAGVFEKILGGVQEKPELSGGEKVFRRCISTAVGMAAVAVASLVFFA